MKTRRAIHLAARVGVTLAGTALLALPLGSANAAQEPPIALGVNIANAPDQAAPIQDYVNLAHKAPAIVMWYQQWSEPLYYSDQMTTMAATSAIPMITWDPIEKGVGIPLSQIVAGDYDSTIKAAAAAAAAWGRPMYIRLAHEMNLGGSAFGPGKNGNTPAEYVAAWRHVVTIFRQQGATNVQWVWSPNVYCGGKCPFTAFYPGDAWVDWVALDGYNYSTVDNVPWMSFDQISGPSYKILTAMTSKPVMIGETGSTEEGGNKAQWITQTFSTLPSKYPQIHAVIWFDRDKETDWRVNSSAASLAAWQQVGNSTAYSGSASTLMTIAAADGSAAPTVGQSTASVSAKGAGPSSSTTGARSRRAQGRTQTHRSSQSNRKHRHHHKRRHHSRKRRRVHRRRHSRA